jgi:hypothetical protein
MAIGALAIAKGSKAVMMKQSAIAVGGRLVDDDERPRRLSRRILRGCTWARTANNSKTTCTKMRLSTDAPMSPTPARNHHGIVLSSAPSSVADRKGRIWLRQSGVWSKMKLH